MIGRTNVVGGKLLPDIGGTLASYTWEEINTITENGFAKAYFAIGDEASIVVNGETLTIQIYGFNHDDKTNGTGKAGITFGTKHLMATKRRMNATNTTVGGWTSSEMRAWIIGTLLTQLPSDLKNVVKEVNKPTSAGNLLSTINITSDKVFLFSEIETCGDISSSKSGEGTKYPIFTDNPSRIKKLSNGLGLANAWWERSPYSNDRTAFCGIGTIGSYAGNASSMPDGVAFGFCV